MMFWKPALFPFSGKETPNLVGPLELRFSIDGHHSNSNLLRYVPENRFSPKVVKGKRLVKN